MRKKIFAIVIASLFLLTSSIAFACGPFGCLDVDAKAGSAAIDCDARLIPNGGAFGISGAIGGAKAGADGFVFNGTVEGDVDAWGGGLTVTDAYRFNPHMGDKSIGVGSSSESYALTGAKLKIKVDPGYFGFGEVDGHLCGFAAQGTLNASGLIESPKYFDTEGFTGGIAGQGSIGGFSGGAFAVSGPDIKICRWKIDSKSGAGAGAEIAMSGGSYSESYRFVDWSGCGPGSTKTEGMGTVVGAYTNIESYGYDYDWDKGCSESGACLRGGYMVAGGAATKTVQDAPGCGGAKASAVGFYVGAGSLGTNYNGSAIGYSNTSVTTMNGMNGSINTASAGMSVTSKITHGCGQLD